MARRSFSWCCFNPRAREGRDSWPRLRAAGIRRFNPRAREGRDLPMVKIVVNGAAVSIHAPVRGATAWDMPSWSRMDRFNPRAREGRDVSSWRIFKVPARFQSTRP